MRDFQRPGRSAVHAVSAMAATSHPAATLTAIELLRAGGNAADASVGAAALLGFCEPSQTGLGGDCFALVRPAGGGEIEGLNASGPAPAELDAAAMRAAGHSRMPETGAIPVTVPGAVGGLAALAQRHGRLGLAACLAPAIRAAEEGVPVAPRVALDWQRAADRLSGAARQHFLDQGAPPAEGTRFRAPGQAEVLRRISAEGPAGFYQGEVAADMLAALRAAGGCHTEADFASFRPSWVTPIRGGYRDAELVELPPNGQGATAILMAGILEHFDLAALDPFGEKRTHLEAEAAKLAHDARDRFVADPAAGPLRLGHMISPKTATALAHLIDPARAIADPAPLSEAIHSETVYLTVVDAEGMAVSLIYSIYSAFGAGIASDRFGILFHNRGAGFTLTPGHPNEAAGGKRPLHTIIPAMLCRDGRLEMSFGVMGGAYQPTGHVRVMGNLLDFGMDLQEAIDGPRSFAGPGGLELETGYADGIVAGLQARGHHVTWRTSPLGGAQAIHIDAARGILTGASDPRKDGCALGY